MIPRWRPRTAHTLRWRSREAHGAPAIAAGYAGETNWADHDLAGSRRVEAHGLSDGWSGCRGLRSQLPGYEPGAAHSGLLPAQPVDDVAGRGDDRAELAGRFRAADPDLARHRHLDALRGPTSPWVPGRPDPHPRPVPLPLHLRA